MFLRQSTATTIVLGPFVDDTDGKTAETALTISQADVLLWKHGGTTFAQKNESTACTHRSNGCYTCPLDTTDTATLGQLIVSVAESGALPVKQVYTVLPPAVYDALIAGNTTFSALADNLAGCPLLTVEASPAPAKGYIYVSSAWLTNAVATNDRSFMFVTGDNAGQSRLISGFTQQGGDVVKLEFATPFVSDPASGNTGRII